MLERCAEPQRSVVLRYDASAVALPPGEHFVGRSASCFLCIEDPAVSRHHLRFVVDAQRAIVEDLGSTNGTLVNGRPLRGAHALADGDLLTLGNRVLHVRFVDAGAVRAVEPRTPAPVVRRQTPHDSGVQLSECCPRCREPVTVGVALCPSCGYRWPRAPRKAPTAPEQPALRPQRDEQRSDVRIPVRYVSKTMCLEAQAENISLGGAFIAAARLDPIGTPCTVEFGSGDGRAVLHGCVRHLVHRRADGEGGMGIAFNALSDETEGWLVGCLAQAAIRSLD